MDRGSDWWLLLPERVRRFPADLTATVVLTLLTIIVVLAPIIRDTPLRVVLGLPFVLFLPGYAFVAELIRTTLRRRRRALAKLTLTMQIQTTNSRMNRDGLPLQSLPRLTVASTASNASHSRLACRLPSSR